MTVLSRIADLFRPLPVPEQKAEEKAVGGFGTMASSSGPPVWSIANTPQRRAWQAAMLYRENTLIRLAETPVSTKAGSVPWHLETPDDERIEDGDNPALVAIRDLLEKPQAALPIEQRQEGLTTRRGLWTLTLRHMGLCGTTFWYLDQTEALAGTPLAILYLAPWRLYEVRSKQGQFLGWTLDKSLEEGGTPLERTSVLPFHLVPPDEGPWAPGLVETAGLKASLDPLITRHIAKVIGSGGRLTGLLSPKAGTTVTGDQWQQFVRDYRNITNDPDAAQRLQIVQGPVDYVRTSATPDEMAIPEIDNATRDAILGLWGVPRSQVGVTEPTGLNSGIARSFEEAVLWQGAIHSRLQSFYETVQYGLLDRYKPLGLKVELKIDEPEFDDDTPQYDKAVKATNLPLTVAERREILGKEPFGEKVLDEQGRIVDNLVFLPLGQTEAFYASENLPPPMPVVTVSVPEPPLLTDGKARLTRFVTLRRNVDETLVPKVKNAVAEVLAAQKDRIVGYLRKVGLEHLRKKRDFGWDQKRADDMLRKALQPELGRVVAKVAAKTHAALPAKAAPVDEFTDRVLARVVRKGGERIAGINHTTRDRISEAISEALADADTINDVIDRVEALDIFGELRAETIARTETMFAYNDAALASYGEFGIKEVQAIDGDKDAECADRDGRVYPIEDAEGISDHPNGTLDWVPIVPDEPPAKAKVTTLHKVDGRWVIEEVA